VSRILIAEDEAGIAAFVEKGLRDNGFATTVAAEGREALRLARSGDYELLILDLGLPGLDGLDVLRELRRRDLRLPVVILTARDTIGDTVAGLEGGADDYVAKPFRFDELLARVRARLREVDEPDETILTVGSASLDLLGRCATASGTTVQLSARELAVAELFFRHPGQVLSREQILRHVWGHGYEAGSNVVEVYVGHLRRKLGRERIVTVRDVGYRLEPNAGAPGRRRVLVVEPETGGPGGVGEVLARDGHDVVVVEDGEVGGCIARAERFDLVLVDAGLDGAARLDVLLRFAAQLRDLPVVVLTAELDPEVGRLAVAAGATHLVAQQGALAELRDFVRDRVALVG
jgi:DNA-binding response OmpR family regulator